MSGFMRGFLVLAGLVTAMAVTASMLNMQQVQLPFASREADAGAGNPIVRFDCRKGPADGKTEDGRPSHFHIQVTVGGKKVGRAAMSVAKGDTCVDIPTMLRGLICVGGWTCSPVAAGPPATFDVTNTPSGRPTDGIIATDDRKLHDSLCCTQDASFGIKVAPFGTPLPPGGTIATIVTVEDDGSETDIHTEVSVGGKSIEVIREELAIAMQANGLNAELGPATAGDLGILEPIMVSADATGAAAICAACDGIEPTLACEIDCTAVSVGGITQLLVDGSNSPERTAEQSGSSPPHAPIAAAVATAVAALAAGGWYVRRRLS